MKTKNEFTMKLYSRSCNESFARVAAASFISQLDPTIEEINDIKTAVSEAVTNCIVHGYKDTFGYIYMSVQIYDNSIIKIRIRDKGCGIEDIEKAMEPMYTTAGDERAGLGFAVMQSFMDKVRVTSQVGKGTTVTFTKKLSEKR